MATFIIIEKKNNVLVYLKLSYKESVFDLLTKQNEVEKKFSCF